MALTASHPRRLVSPQVGPLQIHSDQEAANQVSACLVGDLQLGAKSAGRAQILSMQFGGAQLHRGQIRSDASRLRTKAARFASQGLAPEMNSNKQRGQRQKRGAITSDATRKHDFHKQIQPRITCLIDPVSHQFYQLFLCGGLA